ncbi:MAG: hypothetical protein IAE96_04875 [Chitinophagaceae bacterium]|nr:hypothetical protein [Chitinophagaceae bacterium]
MAITVLQRPYTRNWSGNPIHYRLYSAAAEADATIYFQIRVLFKRMDQAVFSNIIEFPYTPVLGTAKIDIQDILDGLLEHELPYLVDGISPYLSSKSTGKFYIHYREITTATPDPAWTETEEDFQLLVVKGGISWEQWRGDNYWVNYFDNTKPFLTWQKSGTLHSPQEKIWLAWLNLTTIYPGNIRIKRTVRFTDGSEDVEYYDNPVNENQIGFFPAGATQLNLSEVDPSKNIYWWEIQVMNTGTNPYEPISELFRFYMDNRPDKNATTLHYRNSLGGLDSARIRGVIDYTAQREFSQTERIVLHDYFSNYFIKGRVGAENSTELKVMKGNTGHLGKEEQDRLRDMHLKREVWQERQEKWLPIILLTGTQHLLVSTDKLFDMPLEWAIASGGNLNYTPDSVNLSEAATVVGPACTAVIGDLEWNYVPGTGWVVSWNLVSGAPNKYQVSTPAVSGGAPGETAGTSYTLPWLPVGDNVVKVQPVCLIGGEYYLGTPQYITVTVEPACVNVGISGEPIYLPNAVTGIAYNYTLPLTGTAPFSIDNIVKPAWMTVAISGSAVVITGTPSGGDAGTDIEVSFDLANCSGAGTKSYSDTIDVIVAADNGDFLATNEGYGASLIKRIEPLLPPFFTISSGSIPVIAGSQASGVLASALSTPITVTVVLDTYRHKLQLLKNGSSVEIFDVETSGAYSFAAIPILVTDNIEIKLRL